MPRTLGDVPDAKSAMWPPAGWHPCRIVGATKWISPKKKTPAVMLALATMDGAFEFEDPIFITAKAINRVALVARRVCGLPDITALPDDGDEAVKQLANHILTTAIGKQCMVEIEVQKFDEMQTDGPDIGKMKTKTFHNVSFAGYKAYDPGTEPVQAEPKVGPFDESPAGDDIPF